MDDKYARDDIDYLKTELRELRAIVIPEVGDLYFTESDIDPAERFGGEWELHGAGRVPVGYDDSDTDFDTVGETGGAKEHFHRTTSPIGYVGSSTAARIYPADFQSESNSHSGHSITKAVESVTRKSGGSAATGSTEIWDIPSDDSSNVQPYFVVKIWKRIG